MKETQSPRDEIKNSISPLRGLGFARSFYNHCIPSGLAQAASRLADQKTSRLVDYSNSSLRNAGNNNTSRMLCLLISNMARRSTPMPKPPLGGMP